ncbi:MAG: outer membrane protein assembly factor BamD [Gallionella sp.]|jgi:outer membrane protein assembly factor BamD|nr:outer membrane protein assembly factor BamD [Gallionella sp.]MCK9352817.1 outer membrane protein assembly factor BamD [Gallionella sp.]
MRHSLAVILLLTLTACSLLEPLPDGTNQPTLLSAAELYDQAKTELNDGNYSTAVTLYEKLQSRYPYGRYAQQALLEAAYANYRQGESAAAISAADRFIKQYPNHPHIDYAYYVKGLANFGGEISLLKSLGGQDPTERDPKAAQDAFAAFKDLVTRFPNSKYTPDSRLRMQYLVNALAKYEVHVASYYLRRGAHIAAVNRAQGVLTQYPNSPSTRDALEVMVQGYDAMGMTDLRDDAKRVLTKNTSAAEAVSGEPITGKSWWQFWK